MSADGDNSNLYTTRASDDLRDRLDEYVETHEESKSAALRELLDLGEQTAGAEAEPAILQERLNNARQDREDMSEELERTNSKLTQYKFVAGLTVGGIIAALVLTGLFESPMFSGFVPGILRQVLVFIAGLAMFTGCCLWILIQIQPAIDEIRSVFYRWWGRAETNND